MRVATFALSLLASALACSDASEPGPPELVLETDQTSYVATDDPDPRFDYTTRVIVKFKNGSDGVIRVHNCTATATFPPYVLEMEDGIAAWTPDVTCATSGIPHTDVPIDGERVDTLFLRAPWRRLFNGAPVGEFEGRFTIIYDVQRCGSVNANGSCFLFNQYTSARSNEFTITVP